jgi:hypothetical protein
MLNSAGCGRVGGGGMEPFRRFNDLSWAGRNFEDRAEDVPVGLG